MKTYVTVQIASHFAAFGDANVRGSLRMTRKQPLGSMLEGMVNASLGIDRLDPSLVRLHHWASWASSSGMVSDFHMVHNPDLPWIPQNLRGMKSWASGEITRREYLQDVYGIAAFDVRGVDPEHVAQAIRSPKFALFVGRKACALSLPLAPLVVQAKDPLDAVQMIYPCYAAALAVAGLSAPPLEGVAETNFPLDSREGGVVTTVSSRSAFRGPCWTFYPETITRVPLG